MAVLRICLGIVLLTCIFKVIESSPNHVRHERSSPEFKRKRISDLTRRRRASEWKNKRSAYYNPWTPPYLAQFPPRHAFTFWQPPRQQIQRPYLIPIWGPPGKPPVYFPPQPIYFNPGVPVHNRPGNQYLPPKGNTTIPTDNKFGEEDGPIWGTFTERAPTTRPTTQPPTRRPSTPTRRPRPPVTYPPLVRPPSSSNTNTAVKPSLTPEVGNEIVPQPKPQPTPQPLPTNQPSRCVWAIISCCSASSNTVSYDCFEQLGCNGAFWDASPCESDFARAAISTAMNYYQTK